VWRTGFCWSNLTKYFLDRLHREMFSRSSARRHASLHQQASPPRQFSCSFPSPFKPPPERLNSKCRSRPTQRLPQATRLRIPSLQCPLNRPFSNSSSHKAFVSMMDKPGHRKSGANMQILESRFPPRTRNRSTF
jgi:hypothetical protein